MVKLVGKLSGQNAGVTVRRLVFFIAFYVYVWLEIEPHLIYHGGGVITNFPCFYLGWEFLEKFLTYPGGAVEYIAAFLSQFLYYSWAGAILVTLQGWVIFTCSDYFIKRTGTRGLGFVCYIGPALVLTIYGQYMYPFVAITGLSVALAFVCVYLSDGFVEREKKVPDPIFFLALSLVVYSAVGITYVLFAVSCAIYEFFFRGRRGLGVLYLLFCVIIPYFVGVLVFNVSINTAFGDLPGVCRDIFSPGSPKAVIAMFSILYVLVPVAGVGVGLWRVFFVRGAVRLGGLRKKSGKKRGGGIFSWYRGSAIVKWTVESTVLFAVGGWAVLFFHNGVTKKFFEVDYYVCQRKWEEAIECAPRDSQGHFAVHSIDRALYHSGRLGYDILRYPQHPGILLLPIKGDASISWKRFDTYIDLGLINRAEHDLAESLTEFGERPILLERLALVNMVKGRIAAARTFLVALSKTLFHSEWAESYLERLEDDPTLSADELVEELRGLMLKRDYHFTLLDEDEILEDLLENNRGNRMAFEYLMSRYLLTGGLEEFGENLKRLGDFNYQRMPRLYEEAILYMVERGQTVELVGWEMSEETHRRFFRISAYL
ncbi:MAG: DUF6057 family protein [Planctomycetota bacterium]|jgi:hypothetical protein